MADPIDNPYRAPTTSEAPSEEQGDFTIQQALSDGWGATVSNFPLWLGVGIVAVLIGGASAITVIGYFLVLPVLSYGSIKFLLNMLDNKAEFNDLFAGFSNYGATLGRMLLLTVILILLGLVSESLIFVGSWLQSSLVSLIGSLVYLASLVFVILPTSFAFFFAVDRDLPAMEALNASWRITRGKLLKLVGLALLAGLIGVSGILALGVGVIFTFTMSYAMFASAYRQMAGRAPAAP